MDDKDILMEYIHCCVKQVTKAKKIEVKQPYCHNGKLKFDVYASGFHFTNDTERDLVDTIKADGFYPTLEYIGSDTYGPPVRLQFLVNL